MYFLVLFYNLKLLLSYNAYKPGQVGYVICNMKTPGEARVGDTMCSFLEIESVDALPGFEPPVHPFANMAHARQSRPNMARVRQSRHM